MSRSPDMRILGSGFFVSQKMTTFVPMKVFGHTYIGVAVVLGVGLLAGCKDKPKTDTIIAKKPVVAAKKSIQRVGDYEQSRQFAWNGQTYTVKVVRKADASLPIIDDGDGNRYYDNRVQVTITRPDGSNFFNREFTKNDFTPYMDEHYRSGALLGVVFDCVEDGVLRFAASVGSPDQTSDEYVPLVMQINRMGETSVTRDTSLDTVGDEEEQ